MEVRASALDAPAHQDAVLCPAAGLARSAQMTRRSSIRSSFEKQIVRDTRRTAMEAGRRHLWGPRWAL